VARRLLEGKFVDTSDIAYEFDAFHVAAIASGTGAASALKGLADALDCRLFLVPQDEATVWAWFGNRKKHDLNEARPVIARRWPPQIALAIGEAERGLSGWRRSHRQADAAFGIAVRKPGTFVRYADDLLLASCMKDDLLRRALHELYLAPLAEERDGGVMHRKTLRAYFEADRNGASAAHALGVSRQTVTNRLQAVQAKIGRPLAECGAELEVALRLEDLGGLTPVAG
jgi:sugar diacid utilization regulator